jgi:hypothetical protein
VGGAATAAAATAATTTTLGRSSPIALERLGVG